MADNFSQKPEYETGDCEPMSIQMLVIAGAVVFLGAEFVRNFIWKVSWPELVRLTQVGNQARREKLHLWRDGGQSDGQQQSVRERFLEQLKEEMRAQVAAHYTEVRAAYTNTLRQRADEFLNRMKSEPPVAQRKPDDLIEGDFYIIDKEDGDGRL